ncbi:MAG TPA: hypothetical protein VI685_01695 [Candidatus Angelobacter sp.]
MPKVTLVIGSLLAIAGAVCFLALFGQTQSDAIRAIGSALFSVGVLIIAAGVYLQARRIQAEHETPAIKGKKTERLCSQCNREPSLVFCRVHVLRLCLDCFEKHDDGTNCSYVPARRATAAYK